MSDCSHIKLNIIIVVLQWLAIIFFVLPLDIYVISVIVYGSECWTISPWMKKKTRGVWLSRRILNIPWQEIIRNKEWLNKMAAARNHSQNQYGRKMRTEGLENLTLMWHIASERVTYLTWLHEWMLEQRDKAKGENSRFRLGRKMWRARIDYGREGKGRGKKRQRQEKHFPLDSFLVFEKNSFHSLGNWI